ncbi:MAG: hypothetical protein ABSA83_09345 [Verrucomicrobiota bacterium]|jgi:hypothetical protein
MNTTQKRGNYPGVPGATDGRTSGGPVNDGPANTGPADAGAGAANLAANYRSPVATPPSGPRVACDAGAATGVNGQPPPAKSVAQLQTERLLAQSPRTIGQQLQDGWREHPETHPGEKFRWPPRK